MATRKKTGHDKILIHFALGILVGAVLVGVLLLPGYLQLRPQEGPRTVYTGTFKYFEPSARPPVLSVAEGKTYIITFHSNNTNGLPGTGGDLFVYPDASARPGTCTGPANPETMALGDGTTFVNRSGVRGTFQTPPLFADITVGGLWQGALFIESGEWQPGYVRLTAKALKDAVVPLLNDDTKLDDNSGCTVVVVEEV